MRMMSFPNGPINSDASDSIANLRRAESAEAELAAIKRGHGELGRYEQLRLKNAELTAELAKERELLDWLDAYLNYERMHELFGDNGIALDGGPASIRSVIRFYIANRLT